MGIRRQSVIKNDVITPIKTKESVGMALDFHFLAVIRANDVSLAEWKKQNSKVLIPPKKYRKRSVFLRTKVQHFTG